MREGSEIPAPASRTCAMVWRRPARGHPARRAVVARRQRPGGRHRHRPAHELRSPDHGLRAARSAPRPAVRVLPRQRDLQGHAARVRGLPRRRHLRARLGQAGQPPAYHQRLRLLPHAGVVEPRGQFQPQRSARQLRELPLQRQPGRRHGTEPHRHRPRLQRLPLDRRLGGRRVQPQRTHHGLRDAATTTSAQPASRPRTCRRFPPATAPAKAATRRPITRPGTT